MPGHFGSTVTNSFVTDQITLHVVALGAGGTVHHAPFTISMGKKCTH